ncbi:hypothetical protein BN874_340006 [Candidatus Contendobacter odensis Run_B_J11]|uniref:Uncharacterized protein n=1 Tax=Candidatus Contendobacter odensis Run_B_J11 TaxID=1400861 RepID=A0A7U7GDB1_9GAMM|nr:hypothetical protein BN874_340006 [Candidatus Contendobacter odensis Run_B_J11]
MFFGALGLRADQQEVESNDQHNRKQQVHQTHFARRAAGGLSHGVLDQEVQDIFHWEFLELNRIRRYAPDCDGPSVATPFQKAALYTGGGSCPRFS